MRWSFILTSHLPSLGNHAKDSAQRVNLVRTTIVDDLGTTHGVEASTSLGRSPVHANDPPRGIDNIGLTIRTALITVGENTVNHRVTIVSIRTTNLLHHFFISLCCVWIWEILTLEPIITIPRVNTNSIANYPSPCNGYFELFQKYFT